MICKVWQWRASIDPYPVLTEQSNPEAGVTIKNDRGQVFAALSKADFVSLHGQAAFDALVSNA